MSGWGPTGTLATGTLLGLGAGPWPVAPTLSYDSLPSLLGQYWQIAIDGQRVTGSLEPFALALEYGEAGRLITAVLASLFGDARLPDDQPLPSNATDRRGWWADAAAIGLQTAMADDARPRGSLLWTLLGRKSAATLGQIEMLCASALAWMMAAGLASDIAINARKSTVYGAEITIAIARAAGDTTVLSFAGQWEGLTQWQ